MIFSNILEKVLRIEIGLKLERSVLSPDLYIGITFATLRSSRKTPVSNDLLIIYNNGMYGLSSLAGRLSYPGLLLVSDMTLPSLSHTQ